MNRAVKIMNNTFENDNNNEEAIHTFVLYVISHGRNQYIGYTADYTERMLRHQSAIRCGDTNKLYSYIRENGGWGAMTKSIIREWKCTKSQAKLAESAAISAIQPTLNTRGGALPEFVNLKHKRPTTSDPNYNKQYTALWRKVNLDQYKQYQAQWRKNNKEYHAEWKRVNKDRLARKREFKKEFKALCMIEV